MKTVFLAQVETPSFPYLSYMVVGTSKKQALKTLQETWEFKVAWLTEPKAGVPEWSTLVKDRFVTCTELEVGEAYATWNMEAPTKYLVP